MSTGYPAQMAMTLVSGGILRDGGSICADFQRDDGSSLSLLLEVVGSPEPGEERKFQHLHVGHSIQNTCDPSTIVLKGSDQELMLLSDLQDWTESGEVGTDEVAVAALKDLLAHLPTRDY